MSALLAVLLGCFAMNLDSRCNIVLLFPEVFTVGCCTRNIVVGVSQSGGCLSLHLWFGEQTLLH